MLVLHAKEIAATPKWWDGLSPEQQKEYIKEHPSSKLAKNHPLFKAAKEGDNLHNTLKHPLVGIIQDTNGNTPLHYAAEYDKNARMHPDANLTKNKLGHTPKEHFEKFVKKAMSPNWGK